MSAVHARPVPSPRTIAPLLRAAGRDIESTVIGESMGATLPAGARIMIHCGAPAEPDTVVAFVAGESLVAHRLVHVVRGHGGGYLVTQGDGRVVCDPPIEAGAMVGVVTAWRMTDEEPWRPIRPAPRRAPVALAVSALVRLLVRSALALDVRAALAVTAVALTVGHLLASGRRALLTR